jgi:hypothetical protein
MRCTCALRHGDEDQLPSQRRRIVVSVSARVEARAQLRPELLLRSPVARKQLFRVVRHDTRDQHARGVDVFLLRRSTAPAVDASATIEAATLALVCVPVREMRLERGFRWRGHLQVQTLQEVKRAPRADELLVRVA